MANQEQCHVLELHMACSHDELSVCVAHKSSQFHALLIYRLLEDSSKVVECRAELGAEDFSFYSHTAAVPSCFVNLGTGSESLGTTHGLHTSRFKLDESILPVGAALHAALATRFIRAHQP